MHPYGAQDQITIAQQQQAAMAALSGGPGSSPSPFLEINAPDCTHIGHTHTNPEPPRLSMDYGSLPRWSDCPSFVPGAGTHSNNAVGQVGNGGRFSCEAGAGAGRYSYGRNSDYASACSTPARMSADVERSQAMAAMHQHHQQQQRDLYQQQQRDLGSFAEASSGRSSGNSGRDSPPSSSSQQQGNGNNGVPSPVRRSIGSNAGANRDEIQDDELAHSLATLKIALTQQNAATTTASNHEVVINTLHQILREAVASAQQEGNNEQKTTTEDTDSSPLAEDASSAAAAAYAALASSMAAFAHNGTGVANNNNSASGTESFPGSRTLSISEISGDTPNRSSLEAVCSPSTAGDLHGIVAPDGENERSTYRLSQDLCHALY
jgi:hypothetical protein